MKRQSIPLAMLAVVLVSGLMFAGCENWPSYNEENNVSEPIISRQFINDGGSFNAKILEIRESFVDDNYVLVEPSGR